MTVEKKAIVETETDRYGNRQHQVPCPTYGYDKPKPSYQMPNARVTPHPRTYENTVLNMRMRE